MHEKLSDARKPEELLLSQRDRTAKNARSQGYHTESMGAAVLNKTLIAQLNNHLPDIAAIDMFVVATATFQLLYALIVLSLDRRRVVHFAVTPNPTQDWLSRQMTEAFPWDTAPRYLLRDRDKSYGPALRHRVRAMGITEVITAPRSPWQNRTRTISHPNFCEETSSIGKAWESWPEG
jgi:hypothetical protein